MVSELLNPDGYRVRIVYLLCLVLEEKVEELMSVWSFAIQISAFHEKLIVFPTVGVECGAFPFPSRYTPDFPIRTLCTVKFWSVHLPQLAHYAAIIYRTPILETMNISYEHSSASQFI